MLISLRRGLREIIEIILTPTDEKNNKIKDLKDVIVCLQLKEEMKHKMTSAELQKVVTCQDTTFCGRFQMSFLTTTLNFL